MPTFKLNGSDAEFRPGEMIIEAAARAGVNIPYYCYHPELSSPANCRMCLVEAKGAPKLIPSCQQACNDKMEIFTETPRVKTAQADVMEFLLINHPLDCPICDQAGECKLQQYAYLFGRPQSSMEEAKVKLEKRKVLGPHVLLDQERCIACTRCVRFVHEVTNSGELTMIARGNRNVVDLHEDAALQNAYSGCVVDMCPVGALTDRQFRFEARVWYVQPTATTCTLCSRGCNVSVDRRGERGRLPEIKRIRARRNPEVNASWICDEGRYGYLRVREGQRTVKARGGDPAQSPTRLEAAQLAAATMLKSHSGRGWLGVLASGSETLEELSALAELARAVDPDAALVVLGRPDAAEDPILRRTDHSANQRGARLLGWGSDFVPLADRKLLLLVDADLRPEGGVFLDWASKGGRGAGGADGTNWPTIALIAHERDWAARADVVLPLANAFEKDGTIVNFEGVVQRLQRVVTPPTDARPAHHHAAAIAAFAGLAAIETDTAARLATLCAGPLAPLDPAQLTEWGARMPAERGGAVRYHEEPHQLFTAAPKTLAEGEYRPFMDGDAPPPAIHVGAGIPPRPGRCAADGSESSAPGAGGAGA